MNLLSLPPTCTLLGVMLVLGSRGVGQVLSFDATSGSLGKGFPSNELVPLLSMDPDEHTLGSFDHLFCMI